MRHYAFLWWLLGDVPCFKRRTALLLVCLLIKSASGQSDQSKLSYIINLEAVCVKFRL